MSFGGILFRKDYIQEVNVFFISRDLSFVLMHVFILLKLYAYLMFLMIIQFQNHPAQNFKGIPMIFQ